MLSEKMPDSNRLGPALTPSEGQCQFFVLRKKRLCRMTVRPGKSYCGEHEPQPPQNDVDQADLRIPCPYDSKHTCYASRLQHHLTICNARHAPPPPYIVHNINCPAPAPGPARTRRTLAQVPPLLLHSVIQKINALYEEHLRGRIPDVAAQPVPAAMLAEYCVSRRGERSRRHLRQAASIMRLAEAEGLVRDDTCYVELGAGKGQLSYYVCVCWCAPGSGSRALLVERAPLRHKRDNRLGRDETGTGGEGDGDTTPARGASLPRATRLRADVAHVRLAAAPAAQRSAAVVGLAKHLCGVATDYALRCLTAADVVSRTRGAVLATCCHHRCERAPYVGTIHMQELGITDEDFEVMLGIVSWATCGDGRSRDRRRGGGGAIQQNGDQESPITDDNCDGSVSSDQSDKYVVEEGGQSGAKDQSPTDDSSVFVSKVHSAKSRQSFEHESAITNNNSNEFASRDQFDRRVVKETEQSGSKDQSCNQETPTYSKGESVSINLQTDSKDQSCIQDTLTNDNNESKVHCNKNQSTLNSNAMCEASGPASLVLSREAKAVLGVRAKALLDLGRVRYLRACGLRARLCRYVPAQDSLENLCIVASRED